MSVSMAVPMIMIVLMSMIVFMLGIAVIVL